MLATWTAGPCHAVSALPVGKDDAHAGEHGFGATGGGEPPGWGVLGEVGDQAGDEVAHHTVAIAVRTLVTVADAVVDARLSSWSGWSRSSHRRSGSGRSWFARAARSRVEVGVGGEAGRGAVDRGLAGEAGAVGAEERVVGGACWVAKARRWPRAPPMVAQWSGSSTRCGRIGRADAAAVATSAATRRVPVRVAAHHRPRCRRSAGWLAPISRSDSAPKSPVRVGCVRRTCSAGCGRRARGW